MEAALGVLDSLADRVGPTGSVLGIDREPRMLQMAELSLAERDLASVELALGDAAATGLPADSFDLVHERLVLINVTNPEAIVAELVRMAWPGGYVVSQNVDWIGWICQPPHPAWDRLYDATARAWVGDVFIGRRLPGLLRDAGLVDVGVDASVRTWRPGDPYHKLLLRWVDRYRDRIIAAGTMTEAELDGCMRDLDAHLDRPETFTLYHPTLQAWGRKA